MLTNIRAERIVVDLFRTETTEHEHGKSYRSVPDGSVSAIVHLRIDVDALIRKLGAKALRSKGGKAREAGGLIEAVVSKHTRTRREATP